MKQRFEFYLEQASLLLKKSEKAKSPSLWLYQNGLRTPVFMLEALCKAGTFIYHKKRFTKLKDRLKQIEDGIGAIDYYDVFIKEWKNNRQIPKPAIRYMQDQRDAKCNELNSILLEDGWTGKQKRIEKIRSKLKETAWLNENKELLKWEDFYKAQIKKLTDFFGEVKGHFDNVELDIHEMRRKLRWLSIYAQAIGGGIQLAAAPAESAQLKKYLVKEVLESPFNKMPEAGDRSSFLLLSKNHFLALSWVIAELGKIKDKGLHLLALKEALMHSLKLDEAQALKQALQHSGKNQPTLNDLLKQAEKILTTFFNEKNLNKLILGTANAKP